MTARMTGTEGSGLPVIPSTDVMMFRLFRSGFRNVPSFSVPDAMISSPFPEILSGSGHFRLSDPRKTGILYFDEQPFLKYFRSHSHERQKHP